MPLLTLYFLVNLIGQIPGSLWIINGEDRFGWDVWMVGLTFAAFGILHAVAQAFFTEPTTRRFGERGDFPRGRRRRPWRLSQWRRLPRGGWYSRSWSFSPRAGSPCPLFKLYCPGRLARSTRASSRGLWSASRA